VGIESESSHNKGDLSRHPISIYIFYHNKDQLERVIGGVAEDPRFRFIDLNSLSIPDALRIEELDEFRNRALFSEYLGLLSINADEPGLVGLFTYSIPLKFCKEWAYRTGHPNIFLPEITFDAIAQATYQIDHLYAVEYQKPWIKHPNEIALIHKKFRVGSEQVSPFGPYKASIIVNSQIFSEFLLWFKEVCHFLVSNIDWRIATGGNSLFSASAHAGKSQAEMEVDKIRHGLGDIMERAFAYYFAQRFPERKKYRLGQHLAVPKQ